MGERIRAFPWSEHPLGPPEAWPQALRTAVRLMLNTGHPMYIFWGPELFCFYNDAYSQSIGPERHPVSLGKPGREVWDEIWDIIGPQIDQVMSGGGATWHVNALVPITRHGKREDVYWTYSYGPIDDEQAANGVGGVLVVCTETTATVLAERRQRRLFEQAPAFIIVMRGPDHVVEFVNDAHRRLFGSDDWIGRPAREAVPSVEGQGIFEQLDEVFRTGVTYSAEAMEVRYRRTPDAPEEVRYLTFIFAPRIGDHGEVVGIFCEGFDVSERRQAEASLRDSEDRLRLATEAAAIGTWDFNPITGELRWDARCKELFGLPPDAEVSYETAFLAGLHPDDRERTHAAVQEAITPGGSGAYDIEYRTVGIEDGVERWIAATGNAIFDDGRAVRFVGTVIDISPRKLANRRLEIVANTGAAVAAELDLDKIVQIITDAGVELTGAQFGAFFYNVVNESGEGYMLYALSGVPRSAFEKFPMPRNTAVFAPTFAGDGPVRSDDILKDPRYGKNAPYAGMPEGHLPVRSYLALPVTSRSGEVLGGLFFGHADAGVFKPEHEELMLGVAGHAATAIDNARLVQALQGLNSRLEQLVADEVGERLKAEELLRQSQKLEAIGQLTGGVAHDFNNLLMVVSGGLNMLERTEDSARRQVLVDRMREAVTRGATLTQQLLAFSRKQELKPEIIDFKAHLSAMGDLLDRSLGANVSVEADTPDNLWPVYADQTALQLAVLNLAVNARDAMPDGGTIVIRARNGAPRDPAAPSVSISVIDTGVGMSAETKARIFEPFFTTKEIGKGSGLGLAQVHGFAEQSGGRVEVESEPGRGSTFTLILPKSDAPAKAAAPAQAPGRAAASAMGKVLLVEDDNEVAAMTSEMLEHLGWRVTRAASAEAALAALAEDTQIDVVFSDVMMPGGMSGLDLARELREKRPQMPVVLTSGYSAKVKRDAEAAGLPLVPKPFTIDALSGALSKARAEG